MHCHLSIAVAVGMLAGSALAGVDVQPMSYDMPNGGGVAHGGGWNFSDHTYDGDGDNNVDGAWLSNGLGQLTDDVVGLDNWQADLGNGIAYEWVGWWNTLDPTITFNFGQEVTLETIAIHVNNSGNGQVGMFWHADLSFSSDGENFGDELLYTASSDELADPSARFIIIDMPRTAQYVRVALDHRPGMYWLFISEIQFTGLVEPPCPADFDDDGDVDTTDLLYLLGAWGTSGGDVDGDEDTDTADLLALLAAWGECPSRGGPAAPVQRRGK